MIYLYSHTPKKGVKHVQILGIKFLRPRIKTQNPDALIFTSKNAVIALDKLDFAWKDIPCFVIGEATAREVEKRGGYVEFISKTSHGDEFADEIKEFLKNKRVLFPRAKEVLSNIKEKLCKVELEELILYENLCNELESPQKPAPKSTLIFASPSSIKCFLKYFELDKTYRIICIGKKTKEALPPNVSCEMPKKQSLDACIKLARL